MLNIIGQRKSQVLSPRVQKRLTALIAQKRDHLIIRGISISTQAATPLAIQDRSNHPLPESQLLTRIAQQLGRISPKGIENTLRFTLANGKKNEETWHGHFQHKYSLLFCLKADKCARTYVESANWIMHDAGALGEHLTTKHKYFADQEPFAIIETLPHGYGFSSYIFDRSDFETNVKDLDLPDALKKLRRIKETAPPKTSAAISYLLTRITHPRTSIVYRPGDLAIFDERSTIRFSPSYRPSKPETDQRWLLATSVK